MFESSTSIDRKILWARIGLALLAAFTATNFLVMKLAIAEVTPLSMVVWRFFFAAAFLLPLSKGGKRIPSRRAMLDGGFAGLLLGAAMLLLVWSLAISSTGETAFFVSSDAALVPIISFLFLGERIDRRVILGVVLAIGGLGLLSLDGHFSLRPGSLFGILAALAFSFWVLAVTRFAGRHHPFMLSLAQMIAAFVVTLAGGALLGGLEAPQTPFAWACCIYLGAVATGLRFALQSYLQRFLTATETSLIYLVEPVAVAAIGTIFLGEHLTPAQLFGCLMILGGIILSQVRRRKEESLDEVARLLVSEA